MALRHRRLRVVGIGGTLRRALEAAQEAGAETELLDLRELNLPMYGPGRPPDDYGVAV